MSIRSKTTPAQIQAFNHRRTLLVGRLWLAGALCCLSGCAQSVGITGSSAGSGQRARQNPHFVHVGERVDFVIDPPEDCSYVLVDFCGQEILLDQHDGKKFTFDKLFDQSWADKNCLIRARAYKTQGHIDVLGPDSSGKVLKRNRQDDPADLLLGQGYMQLRCYQSQIRLTLRPSRNVRWERGILKITGQDNRVWLIRQAQFGREGFTVLGPNTGGNYIVFYEPRANQINRSGKTEVIFTVPDGPNRTIHRKILLRTP